MRVPPRRISTARAVQRPASPLSLRASVNQISAPPGAVATSESAGGAGAAASAAGGEAAG
jgi:hypothetical protein